MITDFTIEEQAIVDSMLKASTPHLKQDHNATASQRSAIESLLRKDVIRRSLNNWYLLKPTANYLRVLHSKAASTRKPQAQDIKVGDSVTSGSWLIEVNEITEGHQKNGVKTITLHGPLLYTKKDVHGHLQPAVQGELKFKASTYVRIS